MPALRKYTVTFTSKHISRFRTVNAFDEMHAFKLASNLLWSQGYSWFNCSVSVEALTSDSSNHG